MKKTKKDEILKTADLLCKQLDSFDKEDKIDLINKIREKIHSISPFKDNPVDFVEWVKSERVVKNDFNPNYVARPEMISLMDSIKEDGFTQPIVGCPVLSRVEVVDGFHRHLVGKDKKISKGLYGYLPISNVRPERRTLEERIKSCVRHNRARGKHQILGMAEIVRRLKEEGVSDKKIAKGLGMEGEELLRLKHQTGLPELFTNETHSRAWKNKGDLSPEELSSD